MTVECDDGSLLYYARTSPSSSAQEIGCCIGGGMITITYRYDSNTELPIDDCTQQIPIDPCDITEGCLVGIGTPCDDNNPSTYNDVIGDNCSCMGEPIQCEDFDLDGICDDIDCDSDDPLNTNYIGMSCDDGDSSTINDVLVDNCLCLGEPIIEVFPPDCEEENSGFTASSWYTLYSTAYNQEKAKGNDYKSPSDLKTEIATEGLRRQSLSLVHLNCDIEIEKKGVIYTEPTMACGLVVPSKELIDEDCVVDVYFPCVEIEDGIESECSDFNTSEVKEIKLFVGGNQVMAGVSCGETVTLEFRDIFHKELEFVVDYKSNQSKTFKYSTSNNAYLSYPKDFKAAKDGIDYYPDCVGPPVTAPPGGPGGPTVGPGPGPGTNPPDFFKKCKLFPDEEFTVFSEIPYDTHIPNIPNIFTDNEFMRYSTMLNPAVFNNQEDWDDPVTQEQFIESNTIGAIDATVYLNPAHEELTRPIIITDGIDFRSDRLADKIMEDGLTSASRQVLFENGFDIIIADYRGGADFMQKNAFALIELIQTVQDRLGPDGEIEAIVGPSMGGQIVRYALQHWQVHLAAERGPYRIKTFISADSPWEGANASPAIQVLASLAKDLLENFTKMDKLPNSPAARQLLIHHVEGLTDLGGNIFGHEREYNGTHHPFRDQWLLELEALEQVTGGEFDVDNIVAVADGAGNGTSTVALGENQIAQPGNNIMNVLIIAALRQTVEQLENVPSPWTSEMRLFATGTGSHLLNYWGDLEDLIEIVLDTHFPVITASEAIDGFDSHPGSPFRLANYLADLDVGQYMEIPMDFTFIPTYSALAIPAGAGNRELDIMGDPNDPNDDLESDFFEDYFVDEVNSGHNEFLQTGTLDFVLDYVDGVDTGLDACTYLEQLKPSSNDLLCYDPTYGGPKVRIAQYWRPGKLVDGEMTDGEWYNEVVQNFMIPDYRVFVENDEGVLEVQNPTVTLSMHTNACGINFDLNGNPNALNSISYDLTSQEFDIEYTGTQNCSVKIEICIESEACPSIDDCRLIDVGLRPAVDDRLKSTEEEIVSTDDDVNITSLKVFPNPSSGLINIETAEGDYRINIYSIEGRMISEEMLLNGTSSTKTNLSPGTYLIRATNLITNESQIEKLVILK